MARRQPNQEANETRGLDGWKRYLRAVLLTVLAGVARGLLNPTLQGDSPYALFLLAVLASVWWDGLGPGLVALGLGGLVGSFFFLVPQWSLAIVGIKGAVFLGMYFLLGTSVCLLGERMRSSLARAEQSEREARHTVEELAQAITIRREIEKQLRQALETAEEATRAKSTFLAYMSHEIRTPLNGILGMLELLGRSKLDERQQRYARLARSSADLLLSLLNDVLDMTRIDLGRLELEEVEFLPAVVLTEVGPMFAASAEQKGLKLSCRVAPELDGLVVHGDPTRLRQVLVNLVSNAVKFSDRGEVQVRAELGNGDPTGRSIRFEVRDMGIGIAPEVRGRLFQAFTQADSSMSRRFGGSGLGLAISRHLVESMGGTIDFESAPGHGSTFWFVIPFKEASRPDPDRTTVPSARTRPEPSRPVVAPGAEARHILVVEDNSINAEVALTLLREAGYPCDLAETGLKAVEMVSARPYDLVLMDCQLPELDGFAATRRIREMERTGGLPGLDGRRVLILALTASLTREVRARCAEAGMDDCLAKPIGADALFRAVSVALGERATATAEVAEGPPAAPAGAVADLDAAVWRLEGKVALLSKLANQFLASAGELRERLFAAARDRDASALGLAAHRLRGQAATFDAAVIVETATQLERLADEGDWPAIATELARLEDALPALLRALTAFRATHMT
jgi:signal transduction histidine kinase/DNA-binding response OmpR family regulator